MIHLARSQRDRTCGKHIIRVSRIANYRIRSIINIRKRSSERAVWIHPIADVHDARPCRYRVQGSPDFESHVREAVQQSTRQRHVARGSLHSTLKFHRATAHRRILRTRWRHQRRIRRPDRIREDRAARFREGPTVDESGRRRARANRQGRAGASLNGSRTHAGTRVQKHSPAEHLNATGQRIFPCDEQRPVSVFRQSRGARQGAVYFQNRRVDGQS